VDASPRFLRNVHTVATDLRDHHPDPRVRNALASDRLLVFAAPSAWDVAIATGPGPRPGGELLLALHYGTPAMPASQHQIRIFEHGITQAAAIRELSLLEQLEESLLHEAEHHYGFCPDGHADCTPDELAATAAEAF
jgi:hypothetical protein